MRNGRRCASQPVYIYVCIDIYRSIIHLRIYCAEDVERHAAHSKRVNQQKEQQQQQKKKNWERPDAMVCDDRNPTAEPNRFI